VIYGEGRRKGRPRADEEREIIENLDVLEVYEFLKEGDVFVNNEALEREDGPEVDRDSHK